MFSVNDFKDYRNALGFGSQTKFREFLSAKDIVANIDFSYIDLLNSRLVRFLQGSTAYITSLVI